MKAKNVKNQYFKSTNKLIIMSNKNYYETPLTTVVEFENEGVLCASFEEYEEQTLDW